MAITGFDVNFDYRSGEGLSWMQWEDLMRERMSRAEFMDDYGIQVHTDAWMTPYDPSAGGTKPIMHYLRYGWQGDRAAMKPRWPPGYVAERLAQDHPYGPHLSWVTQWIIEGKGSSLPRDTYFEIWKDMAEWLAATLFGGPSPTEQWDYYKRTGHGMFGPSGPADPHIIRPWEKNKAEDTRIKRMASRRHKSEPDRHADVYTRRGPGFLESMFDIGPVVNKN